jgi:hypothetical protein
MVGKTLRERFDFYRMDSAKVEETPQGFLRVGGRLTRVGVLPYYLPDGSVYRELRLPSEIFKLDSLRTLQQVPVTDLHGGMVTPDNVQALQVGITGTDITGGKDGPFVTGSATIQRADTIKAVRERKRSELSPGYQCWVEDGAGEWDGSAFGLGLEPYDGIQRDPIYNHLAVGPSQWGRSGPDVRLHLDSIRAHGAAFARADSHELGNFLRDRFSLIGKTQGEIAKDLQIDVWELGMLLDGFVSRSDQLLDRVGGLLDVDPDTLRALLPADPADQFVEPRRVDAAPEIRKDTVTMKTIQITLDGVSFEVQIPEALAGAFETRIDALKKEAGKVSDLAGQLAAEQKAHADSKGALAKATDPAALQAARAERDALEAQAKTIAPDLEIDTRADAKTVKVEALVASGFDQTTFDGADAGFVDGCFASALHAAKTKPAPSPEAPRSAGPAPETHQDDKATPVNADEARARMLKRGQDQWQSKLDASL